MCVARFTVSGQHTWFRGIKRRLRANTSFHSRHSDQVLLCIQWSVITRFSTTPWHRYAVRCHTDHVCCNIIVERKLRSCQPTGAVIISKWVSIIRGRDRVGNFPYWITKCPSTSPTAAAPNKLLLLIWPIGPEIWDTLYILHYISLYLILDVQCIVWNVNCILD